MNSFPFCYYSFVFSSLPTFRSEILNLCREFVVLHGAKPHIIFPYHFNTLSKFPVHDHIKINYEVEPNYSDIFRIEFNVEIEKCITI